jgi:hypothetical protein
MIKVTNYKTIDYNYLNKNQYNKMKIEIYNTLMIKFEKLNNKLMLKNKFKIWELIDKK